MLRFFEDQFEKNRAVFDETRHYFAVIGIVFFDTIPWSQCQFSFKILDGYQDVMREFPEFAEEFMNDVSDRVFMAKLDGFHFAGVRLEVGKRNGD